MGNWPQVLAVAAGLVLAKALLNAGASLVFRWSVPGSTQLGLLLAQGSEFAFVIFSLPPVRAMVGEARSAVLIAAVALTLAITPNLAEAGRALAGRLRRRRMVAPSIDPELQQRSIAGPVFIAGMGPRGRTVADALVEFGIGYAAVEDDQRRLRLAIADGYDVAFGDIGDPRLWESVAMESRRVSVLTAPSLEVSSRMTPVAERFFPHLKRIAVVDSLAEAARFAEAGLTPVLDDGEPPGLAVAIAVLSELGTDPDAVAAWARRQQRRALAGMPGASAELEGAVAVPAGR